MQEQLEKALNFANYQQTFTVQRKNLKERINAKLTYGVNGGLFFINHDLLTFVDMLCNNGRISGIVILDLNQNPILIDDMLAFKDEIFSRYFESTNEYFESFQNLKKSRSVEKLLEQ
jgi:hypothetical protein